MASKGDGIPSGAEIERQRKRMLDSKCFQKSPNRAMLLDYVVRKALDDEEISEDIIGYALFRGYAPDLSDDVRITARNLRRSLEEYYAQEGVDDLVRIELPRGPKYRPLFSYNVRSLARQDYSRGLGMLSQLRLREAEEYFAQATRSHPKYAEPYLALATTYLLYPMCSSLVFVDLWKGPEWVDSGMWLAMSRGMVTSAQMFNQKWWRVFVMRGVVHCYRHQWEKANRAFEIALKVSPEDTRDDPWYIAYLATTGNLDQAAAILNAKAKDSPNDVALATQRGFVLYVMRQFHEAQGAFIRAFSIDERYWPAWIGYALLLLEKETQDGWLNRKQSTHFDQALVTYFPGLFVLILGRAGKIEEARGKLHSFSGTHRMDALQSALGYMGVGQMDEAVLRLHDAAFLEYNPVLLWIHLWPIFDPLREHERFKTLLQKMNLPAMK